MSLRERSLVTYGFSFAAGTGHIVYPLLPVIYEVARNRYGECRISGKIHRDRVLQVQNARFQKGYLPEPWYCRRSHLKSRQSDEINLLEDVMESMFTFQGPVILTRVYQSTQKDRCLRPQAYSPFLSILLLADPGAGGRHSISVCFAWSHFRFEGLI